MEYLKAYWLYLTTSDDTNKNLSFILKIYPLVLTVVIIYSLTYFPIGVHECTATRVVDTVCWTRPDDGWYAEQYVLLEDNKNIAVRHCGKVKSCMTVTCNESIPIGTRGYCYTPSGVGPTIIYQGLMSTVILDGGSKDPPIFVTIMCLMTMNTILVLASTIISCKEYRNIKYHQASQKDSDTPIL